MNTPKSNDTPETSLPLDEGLNPRQRTFADLYLSGVPATRAYTRAGFQSQSASSNAYRLLAHPSVAAYIAAEQKRMADESRLQKWQVIDFLCRVITTPVHGLPDDSPLIQEHVTMSSANGDFTRIRVKMISKLDAIKQLYLFLGWSGTDLPVTQRSEDEIVSEAFGKMLDDIRNGRGNNHNP